MRFQHHISKLSSSLTGLLLLSAVFMTLSAKAELIVLASPESKFQGNYYANVEDSIFDFHVSYAKQISKHDQVLVLTDKTRAADYIEALGEESVLVMPMLDIWMRDFTLSNTVEPIMFRYTAAAQDSQRDADEVQHAFYKFIKKAGLKFKESDLLNDGGNLVDDYLGNVVVSTKFLKDNHLSESGARKLLTAYASINNVAFIEADEQGGLEHADGVVSFIDENTLIINSYPEDPAYAAKLKADLKRGLPGVKIHEIPTPYDGSDIYDNRFGSACGLYTNALVTPKRIYLPQFGIPEDQEVLAKVRKLSSKQVIPVSSEQVCFMGGGVRCMSWQLRGKNAKMLLDFKQKLNNQAW